MAKACGFFWLAASLQMILDCHVHICAFTPEHGRTSARTLNSIPFRFMRWRLGIPGSDATTEQRLVQRLPDTIDQTEQLHAAGILSFHGVWTRAGKIDD